MSYARFIQLHISSLTTCSLSYLFISNSHNSDESIEHSDYLSNSLLVSLTPISQLHLQKHLNKLGYHNLKYNSFAIIHSNIDKDQYFVFEPLLGVKTSFRLKGLVKNNSSIMGIGNVSSLVGEIKVNEFITYIPLSTNSNYNDISNESIKKAIISSRHNYEGNLLEDVDKSKLTYLSLPYEKQIVLEGRLCLGKYLDDKGNCTFDPSTITPVSIKSSPYKIDYSKDDSAECPLCSFMKKGSCKDEFISWDNCSSNAKDDDTIGKCIDLTYKLMKCMRKDEYYDIMIANTEDKFIEMENFINEKNSKITE